MVSARANRSATTRRVIILGWSAAAAVLAMGFAIALHEARVPVPPKPGEPIPFVYRGSPGPPTRLDAWILLGQLRYGLEYGLLLLLVTDRLSNRVAPKLGQVAGFGLVALAVVLAVKGSYGNGGIEMWGFTRSVLYGGGIGLLVVLASWREGSTLLVPWRWVEKAVLTLLAWSLVIGLHAATVRNGTGWAFLANAQGPFGLAVLVAAWSGRWTDRREQISAGGCAVIAVAVILAIRWSLRYYPDPTVIIWTLEGGAIGALILASTGHLQGVRGYALGGVLVVAALQSAVAISQVLTFDSFRFWRAFWEFWRVLLIPLSFACLTLLVVHQEGLPEREPAAVAEAHA